MEAAHLSKEEVAADFQSRVAQVDSVAVVVVAHLSYSLQDKIGEVVVVVAASVDDNKALVVVPFCPA